jgi:WD40 repeat protein
MSAARYPDAADREQPGAVDRFGDPLPEHARARLGTVRFHAGDLVNQVIYTPDGKSLVSLDWIHTIRVWEAATGRLLREIGEPGMDFRGIAISPDGKELASLEYPGQLRLWELSTGRERRRWHQAVNEFYASAAFSPDGRALAAIVHRIDRAARKDEAFVNVWDLGAPTERRRRIQGEWHSLVDLKLTPDGRILAMASVDTDPNKGPRKGSIRLIDQATGREQKQFAVEGFEVRALAFSSDGKILAAAVADRTIRLFDLASGRERLPRLA